MSATHPSRAGGPLSDKALLAQLIQCADLPSPVGVVMRILELGQDPDVSLADVAEVVTLDPALATRLLRMANSPLYARLHKTENLRQAIKLFGVEGTITLALSFSVVRTLRGQSPQGFDYQLFWRRSLAAATCAQVLGGHLGMKNGEELFLAGLLQDIGMLALARARPELYQGMGALQSRHEQVRARELEVLGVDHAALGAWLLEQWNFPERLGSIVMGSHTPGEGGRAAPCEVAVIAVASDMAELWYEPGARASLRTAMRRAEELLAIDGGAFASVLEGAGAVMLDIAWLFDVELDDPTALESIISQARELTVLRHIRIMQKSAMLEDRTRRLEDENRRDVLTGLINRAAMEQALAREIEVANEHSWPLAVVFFDIDAFKGVNDRYGHLAGDEVLRNVARILEGGMRGSDLVARYGGEEFVIILPGAGADGARHTCDRLLDACRQARHAVEEEGVKIAVTASMGVAVHDDVTRFSGVEDILKAADEALYSAKNQGRDRCVFYPV